jgi:hypothetical protein
MWLVAVRSFGVPGIANSNGMQWGVQRIAGTTNAQRLEQSSDGRNRIITLKAHS